MDLNDLISKKEIEKELENKKPQSSFSEKFWRPPSGKSIIRFLPRLESKIPWKVVYTHRNGNDNATVTCLRTFNKKCPICDKAWEMYNSEIKSEKDISFKVRKKARYLINIMVIKDPENPENDGKIKLLSMGQKMFELLKESFESDDLGLKIFDALDGYNFEINRKKIGDYPDYSSSRFIVKKSAVASDWDEITKDLINIDDTIKEESEEVLKQKFSFLFEGEDFKTVQKSKDEEEEDDDLDTDITEDLDDDDLDDEINSLLED